MASSATATGIVCECGERIARIYHRPARTRGGAPIPHIAGQVVDPERADPAQIRLVIPPNRGASVLSVGGTAGRSYHNPTT